MEIERKKEQSVTCFGHKWEQIKKKRQLNELHYDLMETNDTMQMNRLATSQMHGKNNSEQNNEEELRKTTVLRHTRQSLSALGYRW